MTPGLGRKASLPAWPVVSGEQPFCPSVAQAALARGTAPERLSNSAGVPAGSSFAGAAGLASLPRRIHPLNAP